jgi:hypothetical protein
MLCALSVKSFSSINHYVLFVCRVAEKYPEALRFPFQFTYEHLVKSVGDNGHAIKKSYVYQLEQTLNTFQLLDQILAGMSNLCMPEIKATDFLNSILRTSASSTLNENEKISTLQQNAKKFNDEFKANSEPSVGGSVHSTFYKKYSSRLDKITKLCLTGKIDKSLESEAKNLLKVFHENR